MDGAFSLPKLLHTPFMLIPLLSSMPFLFLFPPLVLPSSVAGATLSGTAYRYVNWAVGL